jgi:hypothetical protein
MLCLFVSFMSSSRALPERIVRRQSTLSRFSVMQSTNSNSEEAADKAFADLFELFSKPRKSPQKAFRTYLLSFENGEPIFTLSEADRILEEVFKDIFDPVTIE